jgi:hypothetical protein
VEAVAIDSPLRRALIRRQGDEAIIETPEDTRV